MKNFTFLILTILTLTLAACSMVSNGADPASAPQTGALSGELPVTTQLILGTLKLEETENAVSAEQAAELLPLWQTLEVLSESDTAADQEKEALITQIQETMTSQQMQAITDMNLSRQDLMATMQEQGMAMGAGRQNSTSQSGTSTGNTNRNFGPGGGMPPPDGGFPGGGAGFGGQAQNLSADQIATAQAARQAAGGNLVPAPLISAVIEYLQKTADS